MRLRRHAAKSRRGVVGPTKKVLELASPSVSSLQGWRKCDRGACRWDCSYDCGKQLSTRLGGPGAQQRRLQAGHRLLRLLLVADWCSSPRPATQHERLELRPRSSVAVPTGTSPSYLLRRLSPCPCIFWATIQVVCFSPTISPSRAGAALTGAHLRSPR